MSDETLPEAHLAIRLAKEGRLSGKDMLGYLVAGKITVPLTEPPRIENGKIADWHPATASREDGTHWLIAFTLPEMASAFGDVETQYGFYMTVDTRWVLERLPPQFGIVFNLRSEEMFEWKAEGLGKYKKDFLGG